MDGITFLISIIIGFSSSFAIVFIDTDNSVSNKSTSEKIKSFFIWGVIISIIFIFVNPIIESLWEEALKIGFFVIVGCIILFVIIF